MNDKQREWAKQYYEHNREKIKKKNLQYYHEHKEEIKEKQKIYSAEYRKTHRDYFRRKSNNRYRKLCGLPPIKESC